MSDTNSKARVKPKNSVAKLKPDSSVDYNDLDSVAKHPLTAVRRGLYAKHLKQYREAAGHTHSSLGRAVGIPAQSIYKWERGETGLSPVEAQRIGKFLNVDAHLFYDDPFLSKIAGSSPLDNVTRYTGEDIPSLPDGSSWWKVSGQVLTLRGVHDGDFVAVEEKRSSYNGCIALLAVAQTDGTTRYLLRERAGGYFVGCGPGSLPEPIPYASEHAQVLGIATALYRPMTQPKLETET